MLELRQRGHQAGDELALRGGKFKVSPVFAASGSSVGMAEAATEAADQPGELLGVVLDQLG